LNFSYLAGDAPAAVATNWRRLQACFPPGTEFVQVHQVHGNRVHRVDAQSRGVTAVADGMVSAAPGVILGILTADCVPVLLYDGAAQVVGALHAGMARSNWRYRVRRYQRDGRDRREPRAYRGRPWTRNRRVLL
jgi:copper oxidase (laccase) domain-containing protein